MFLNENVENFLKNFHRLSLQHLKVKFACGKFYFSKKNRFDNINCNTFSYNEISL